MAIIKCNHCGQSISDKALKCPHCGAEPNIIKQSSVTPNSTQEEKIKVAEKELETLEESLKPQKKKKNAVILYIILGLIIVGVGIAFLMNGSFNTRAWDDEWPYYSQELLDKAKSGDALAQAQISYCYANSRGIEENPEQAFYWSKKSAEQGNAKGLNCLGACYSSGIGVDVDYDMAMRCFKRAAYQGNARAKANVGFMYISGRKASRKIMMRLLGG